MPRFEVKVTKRDADWSQSQGALQSQKSKSVVDSKPDTPELVGREGAGIAPLSCRSAASAKQ